MGKSFSKISHLLYEQYAFCGIRPVTTQNYLAQFQTVGGIRKSLGDAVAMKNLGCSFSGSKTLMFLPLCFTALLVSVWLAFITTQRINH